VLTAETQRTQRENLFIKSLCGLCVSAVSYIKMIVRTRGSRRAEFHNFSHFVLKPFHHGDFIAVREFNTDDAIRPDFQWKIGTLDLKESELFEKFRFVGEGEYFFDIKRFGFL
jgi:hypothetical protein